MNNRRITTPVTMHKLTELFCSLFFLWVCVVYCLFFVFFFFITFVRDLRTEFHAKVQRRLLLADVDRAINTPALTLRDTLK